jgi:hypothetical protein
MSARDLPVYVAQAAPAPLAGWMQRVLQPVIEACCFERGLPVEVRQTGAWRGWAAGRDGAPDGRVALSSRIAFWTRENIVSVYLHESTHRFLDAYEVQTHGPEFFCLNAILLKRSAAFFRLDPIFQLDLYDLQDVPAELENEPNWRGIVLGWALHTAIELADNDASAEALAQKVWERWQQFLEEREQSRVAAALQVDAARKNAAAQLEHIEHLRSSLFFARTFLFASTLSLFSVAYFVFL